MFLALALGVPALGASAQVGGPLPTAGSPPPQAAGNMPKVGKNAAKANAASAKLLPTHPDHMSRRRRLPDGPLDLGTLVNLARSSDLRVEAARAQLDMFEAQYEGALWAWFPSFETKILFGGPVPEARIDPDGSWELAVTEASKEGDFNFGRMGVITRGRIDAAIPIWTFGKLKGFQRAMRNLVDLGHAEVKRMQDEAAYDAARAFWSYQAARQGLLTLDDAIRQARKAERKIERLMEVESDQVTTTDLLKTQLLIGHLEVQRSKLTGGRALALSAMGLLAGAEQGQSITVVEQDLELPEDPGGLDPFVALARKHRPEIAAVDAALAARREEVKIRKAMYYPDFLFAGYGEFTWSNAATDQRNPFVYDPYNYATAGGGIVMRVSFDFPQKLARVRKVEAQVRQLEHQRELLGRAVGLDVEKSWRDLTGARSRATQLTETSRTSRRWVMAAFANFEIGIGDASDLLEPIGAHVATRSARTRAVLEAVLAEASLAKAAGAELVAE